MEISVSCFFAFCKHFLLQNNHVLRTSNMLYIFKEPFFLSLKDTIYALCWINKIFSLDLLLFLLHILFRTKICFLDLCVEIQFLKSDVPLGLRLYINPLLQKKVIDSIIYHLVCFSIILPPVSCKIAWTSNLWHSYMEI